MSLNYRTIWIANTHLGTKACKADYLRDFLDKTHSETLYLIGAPIDFHQFRFGSHAPILHGDIVQQILNKARNGTRVIYIPGKHNTMQHKLVGTHVNGIDIVANALHTTASLRKLLILHGNEFSNVMRYGENRVSHVNKTTQPSLFVNPQSEQIYSKSGYKNDLLATLLKLKDTFSFMRNDDLRSTSLEAYIPQIDGIVCGHIHPAAMVKLASGKTYSNCGDWVESCSALAEDFTGELDVINWQIDHHWQRADAAITKVKESVPTYRQAENNEWLFFTRQ
ncbi:MAG: UDP-2,3-diacylglucosamine diphosphatase [Methylococcaceae bacterium]|nr:UDP-2,3-diacylglucosamine diphosphatase [Methylococcaceae bacterium]